MLLIILVTLILVLLRKYIFNGKKDKYTLDYDNFVFQIVLFCYIHIIIVATDT